MWWVWILYVVSIPCSYLLMRFNWFRWWAVITEHREDVYYTNGLRYYHIFISLLPGLNLFVSVLLWIFVWILSLVKTGHFNKKAKW